MIDRSELDDTMLSALDSIGEDVTLEELEDKINEAEGKHYYEGENEHTNI